MCSVIIPYNSFLDNIERVTAPGYIPTPEDLVHLYIPTKQVQEHSFCSPPYGTMIGSEEWCLYEITIVPSSVSSLPHIVFVIICTQFDLGPIFTQRQVWVPYFDDADVITFLFPLDRLIDPNKVEQLIAVWKRTYEDRSLHKCVFILVGPVPLQAYHTPSS